jgi:hypothetical protein
MAVFDPKDWENEPSTATNISNVALIDLEQRLADWASSIAPKYNVKANFDAVGDGVSDDTDNIQAALDEVEANGGGLVFVPEGSYKLTSQVTIAPRCGILGEGQYTTEFACFSSGAGLKWERGAPWTRGGYSGQFRVNMRETSTLGIHIENSVNRTWVDLRVDSPATNGTAMKLDDCQNCYYFSVDMEGKGGGGGPAGTRGLVFDRGASGNGFFGIRVNDFTAAHVSYRMTDTAWSGVDYPRHNWLYDVMIERGIPGTTLLIDHRAGADNGIRDGNLSLGPGDPDPGGEYSICRFNSADDTGSGTSTSTRWRLEGLKINGGVWSGSRHGIAIDVVGANHYGVVDDCTLGNIKYFMKFNSGAAIVKDRENFVDLLVTSRYTGADIYQRANFLSTSSSFNPNRGQVNYLYVGGTGDIDTINDDVETGYVMFMHFYVSTRTIKNGTGNIYTATGADIKPEAGEVLMFVFDGLVWQQPRGPQERTKGFINHGSTAGTTRPSGYASVEWHGTVEPSNAITGDTWVDTS